MDGNSDFLLQRFDEQFRSIGFTQSCHILDGENVCPPLLQILGEVHVIFQVVFRSGRIEDVSGITDHRFANRSRSLDRIHRALHVLHPVQGVENTKDINPRLWIPSRTTARYCPGSSIQPTALEARSSIWNRMLGIF